MRKSQRKYVCQQCGYESLKWLGRCPDCGSWGSLEEEVYAPEREPSHRGFGTGSSPISLGQVDMSAQERCSTNIGEFDRVLGGGIVPGSLVLIGGEPGIGKSTLLLQVADRLCQNYGPTLYVTGEESIQQIKIRSTRIGIESDNLFILSETDVEAIERHLEKVKPNFLMVDSIQTTYHPQLPSAPATISQVRECTMQFLRVAKTTQIPVFLVGHVTKEGAIAGPKALEHIVDTVLYFEGERHQSYRILRAVKNRFGPTNELGIFEMQDMGLQEVKNPSEFFLSERLTAVSGSTVVATMEGTRPILVELQALTAPTYFGQPRRMTSGIDYHRACLILAVLEKRVGLGLSNQDVYVNVAGGIKIEEPAADLGVAVAVASNFRDVPTEPTTMIVGEIGLAGEVRAVSHIEQRIKESSRLGFKRCVVPSHNLKRLKDYGDVQVVGVGRIEEALGIVLRR